MRQNDVTFSSAKRSNITFESNTHPPPLKTAHARAQVLQSHLPELLAYVPVKLCQLLACHRHGDWPVP